MAYNTSERFPSNPKTCYLLEPGAYQNNISKQIHSNKVPFNLKSPRETQTGHKIWTHAMYYTDKRRKIYNCTSISSKVPRFTHEPLSREEINAILCKCGIDNICECGANQNKEAYAAKALCQAKVPKRIFKGTAPRSILENGISSPCNKERGFKIMQDGSKVRILERIIDGISPFYTTNITEATAFYRGWKWSKWTSSRNNNKLDFSPGPADYKLDHDPSFENICYEKIRSLKRKTSKQLRFLDKIDRINKLENLPGPASYSPTYAQGTDLNFLGPKSERFRLSNINHLPGPTRYYIKRDFDKPEQPTRLTRIKFVPAPFGVQAVRFKYKSQISPSPASYNVNKKTCNIQHCILAPFNSSTIRFKGSNNKDDAKIDDVDISSVDESKVVQKMKELPTWGFRSKTVRMKPGNIRQKEPSPADFLPPSSIVKRAPQRQLNSPFYCSEPRFQAWFNWIPVHGKDSTPGPGYYNFIKPKTVPPFHHASIYPRFENKEYKTPAPNTYKTAKGIENILTTHNQKLKERITTKRKFLWNPPTEKRILGLEEKETILINKSIALLDMLDVFEEKADGQLSSKNPNDPIMYSQKINEELKSKSKLLRCFVYGNKIQQYF